MNLQGRGDLSGQIYRQLRAAILDGRLRSGEPLPPTRELAARLEVSRNTVSVAYDRLSAEGFLRGRVGAGTFVHGDGLGAERRGAPAEAALRPREVWEAIEVPPPGFLAAEPDYDFRAGTPDVRLFPYESWRRLMAREARPSARPTAMYDDPAGHAGLRAAIARHVGVSRSVRAGAGDVIVTQGAQQALDLVGRVLLGPGDRVAVEDPGYPPARALFQSLGARVAGVPVDAEGLDVNALPDDVRMVYVTPSHQFPLGMPMSLARRLALLDWARRRDAVVIEDDYDTELRFAGRPIEPLQSLDASGRVIYVGTFSKVMLPTLRLGFLVAPRSLHRALRAAKYVGDWHSPWPAQAALARFIDEGLLARHVRKMRREYETRYERIAAALERDFAPWLTPIPAAAGLHLSVTLTAGLDDRAVVRRARDEGVGLFGLTGFAVAEPSAPGLVLGYGSIPQSKIDEGLRRLRGVLSTLERSAAKR